MPIPLTAEYDAARLRTAARESKDAGQTRRLLAPGSPGSGPRGPIPRDARVSWSGAVS